MSFTHKNLIALIWKLGLLTYSNHTLTVPRIHVYVGWQGPPSQNLHHAYFY